jgi:hypothetical protein
MAYSNLLLDFLNREHFQTYYTPIAKKLKSVEAAIILQELVQRHQYHEAREELQDLGKHGSHWFYHTKEAIEDRTAILRYSQDKAIDILKAFKLIETVQYGMPCKRYFRLNLEGLEEFSKNLSRKSTVNRQGSRPSTDKAADRQPTEPLYIEEPNKEPNISPLIIPPLQKLPEQFTPSARRLSEQLAQKVKEINPHFTAATKDWPKIFDQMLKARKEEHLKSLIDWTFQNDFWQTVIVSPTNFKKNLNKIEAQWTQRNASTASNFTGSSKKKNAYKDESTPSERTASAPVILTRESKDLGNALGQKMLDMYLNGGKKEKTS